jgi:hypothetical protein
MRVRPSPMGAITSTGECSTYDLNRSPGVSHHMTQTAKDVR